MDDDGNVDGIRHLLIIGAKRFVILHGQRSQQQGIGTKPTRVLSHPHSQVGGGRPNTHHQSQTVR